MKNKEVKGLIALAVVTALSFGVIAGSKALAKDMTEGTAAPDSAAVTEEFDVSGVEGIDAAGKTADGYLVTVREKGYGGDIVMDVAFDNSGSTITGVTVTEQSETENVGSKIAEPEFLDQFAGVAAPVTLPGMDAAEKTEENLAALEGASLTDGDYIAKGETADDNGFVEQVTMTVADGKITAVNWDAITKDGTKKSVLSETGEYVMTEDGPTWKEQAESLANALIENQSLSFFTMDEQGKTDTVSGVSISIGSFISLAEQCLTEAAGITPEAAPEEAAPAEGTVDAVSGATISSTAAVKGINHAYEFLQTVK